jgi:hypothetical protein
MAGEYRPLQVLRGPVKRPTKRLQTAPEFSINA